jgi:Ca-activated chloride channel family protein
MWQLHRGRRLAVAFAALLGAFGTTAAWANEPASVVIIFDGSGSMWGNMEGVRGSKLVVAREALRRALAKVRPQTRVGLASFGHRRGDCGDVEVMRQPEPVDVARVLEPLEKLNPRGRGPLALALREAAKSLPPAPGRRSLVLIHDDADNCQQNVCAVAQELRAAKLTAHVIGLGLKPEDLVKMACLPQATGGRLFNAQNVEQIGAAVEEALKLASSDAGRTEPIAPSPRAPAPSAAPSAGPGAVAVPKPPADAPPGLYLRALLAPKAEAVSLALHWTVTAEGQPGAALFAGQAANPHVPVAPGRYVVEARDGPVSASTVVVAGDKGPTVVELVLNAGALRVRAQAQKTGAPLADAIITISEMGQDSAGKPQAPTGPPLAVFKDSEGLAILPAGRYLVRVEQGLVRTDRLVVVPAGGQGRIDIPLNAARLQLSAVGREIVESADALIFSIAEDDPDAPSGRREVARSAARQADFVLPPGTYYVIARLGLIEARESLAVGPGDVVKRTLSVAAGRLALATKPMAGARTQSEPVSYRVERIDGSAADVITTSRPAPVLLLPGGRYRVEGRYGAMNARVVREIEVKAGQTQQLTLEHQAATLKLRLMGSGGAPLTEVFWDVRDEAGATVWTTGQAEPSATLQAGRYRVRAETRDKRHERAIELRSGEARVVELTGD